MKKLAITTLSIFVTIILITLTFSKATSNNNSAPAIKIDEESNKIQEILNNMTLDEKIGQMLIIDYRQNKMDSEFNDLLVNLKPGGFILFAENFSDYASSQKLIQEIKNTATIPMFMAIDEEGGRVNRLKAITDANIEIPSMQEIGQTNDPNQAYQTGATIASYLNDLGINLDFAPVSDVYQSSSHTFLEDRTFSSDPQIVSNMALNLAKGLTDNNIIATFKHFPGHGSTSTDSHNDLPIITRSYEELMTIDLLPFQNAINNNAQMIMVGHLAIPSLTNDYTPASLSKTIVTDLLKNKLGYQNLIITDALNMKALTNNYTDKEILEMAINAGVDILLMPNNPQDTPQIIKELIAEGKITEDEINTSVTKILTVKEKYLTNNTSN